MRIQMQVRIRIRIRILGLIFRSEKAKKCYSFQNMYANTKKIVKFLQKVSVLSFQVEKKVFFGILIFEFEAV